MCANNFVLHRHSMIPRPTDVTRDALGCRIFVKEVSVSWNFSSAYSLFCSE
jgi:hypothetical protein